MDEFDLIRKFFAPLATAPGADGLRDDVAEVGTLGGGTRLIATADTIVEGVHFLPSDPIGTVAQKLVRVNVSDIVAKGAKPDGCLLALVWPKGRPVAQIGKFAEALGADLKHWGAHLLGGDTTSTDGPLTVSLTMFGKCGPRGPVRRPGATPGDDVWVTGAIGDGWLGLQAANGAFKKLSAAERALLVARYRVPDPPSVALAELVAECASASVDVSDGLVADAGHVAESSDVEIAIDWMDVPLSEAGRRYLTHSKSDLAALLTGGDDYQTLFTAAPDQRDVVRASGFRITRIGRVEEGKGVRLIDGSGAVLSIAKAGWKHME
jgi:thiamine-monophosphate kinase